MTVDVIYCKNCKYYEKRELVNGEIYYGCANPNAGMASGVFLKETDFCSYGEKGDVEE